jgi:hypothetical protein
MDVLPAVCLAQPSLDAPAEIDSLLNFVARAVKDPTIDVAKLESLLRMQREIVADQARLEFNRAMSAVQSEMGPIVRDGTNDQTRSKYAKLETIDAKMRPIYTRHGFLLSFNSEPTEGSNIRIICEVSGDCREAEDAVREPAGRNENQTSSNRRRAR